MTTPRSLDPRLSTLLDSLRSRVRRYVVFDSVLAVSAVILTAFWLGLALDYLPVQLGGTEMPRLARLLLLSVVALAVLVIVVVMLFGRLRRPLPDDSLALLVERHHPKLGGRLVTAVQLNEPDRRGDSHSPKLLSQVHRQAAAAIDQVDPNRVFRWEPLVRKAIVAGPLLVSALVFLAVSPQVFARAASRLTLLSDEPWPRRANLEMVGVELPKVTASASETEVPELIRFVDKTMRLPQGSSGTLRIRAQADGAELPVVCTVYYRTDSGTRGQSNMRRVGRVTDGFQGFLLDGPPLSGLSESLTLNVRGLDDRLDEYRIEAVQPPAITEMTVSVRYPDYLRGEGAGETDMSVTYQSGLRLREGSSVTLRADSSVPLGSTDMALKTDAGESSDLTASYSEDARQLSIPLQNFRAATTVSLVPKDQDGISAQAPYRYFLGVVLDEPPRMEMRLSGIGSAVTPVARIPIRVVADDDYGVKDVTISATASTADGEQASRREEAKPLRATSISPNLNRDGELNAAIDLRDLVADQKLVPLQTGDAISLLGEATDHYDLGTPHVTRSELFRLQIVTPEQLLALMERRELALRSRLEQTIDETRGLRDTLDMLRRGGFKSEQTDVDESEQLRQQQVWRLRVQQGRLQAGKTSEELTGIAASLDDLLREMVNNRIDSVDRRERIGTGVRDPLTQVVAGPLDQLKRQIGQIESVVDEPDEATRRTAEAVQTAEQVLLQLTAVLEKMLDLESFNEILDMVRELIEDQKELLDDTSDERKKRVLELFQ